MKVAVVAYDGFNELDVFANLHIVNRASRVRSEPSLTAQLTCASETVRTMYGVEIERQQPLSFARGADAVIIGSGGTLDAIDDAYFMSELRLDPSRQLIASQCSGALILATLGLLRDQPACTDNDFRPRVEARGVTVLDQPFHANGNVATAGGCLASAHLSCWIISRLLGTEVAEQTLRTVAPVGLEAEFASEITNSVARHLRGDLQESK
jgi:transcriptional regulator GlxA family with amidase domain